MKKSLLTLIASVALASSVHAQLLVAVDYNRDNSPTQSGFRGWSVPNPPNNINPPPNANVLTLTGLDTTYITSGTLNVSMKAGDLAVGATWDNTRDRGAVTGSGSFTYSDLYQDIVFRNSTTPAPSFTIETTFSGLNANTAYQFTFYSYDKSVSNANAWTQTFTAPGASGVINWGTGAPSSNSQYAVTINATVNGSGNITWTQTSSAATGNTYAVVNGFEIAAIPEPSTWALLAGGLTALTIFRRRRVA